MKQLSTLGNTQPLILTFRIFLARSQLPVLPVVVATSGRPLRPPPNTHAQRPLHALPLLPSLAWGRGWSVVCRATARLGSPSQQGRKGVGGVAGGPRCQGC